MKDNPVFKSLIKNGLYAGAILAVYFVLIYLINMNFLQFNLITFLVEGVVLFIFAFLGISEARKNLPDRKIKFMPSWLIAGAVFFMGLWIFGIVKLLIFFVIDPDYFINSVDYMIIQIMENADKIPNAEESIEGLNKFKEPITLITQILVYYTIKSAALGAAIAGIAKKKDRLEETL